MEGLNIVFIRLVASACYLGKISAKIPFLVVCIMKWAYLHRAVPDYGADFAPIWGALNQSHQQLSLFLCFMFYKHHQLFQLDCVPPYHRFEKGV